ncbi:MAG: hypothetical protein IPP06_09635 [Saprospiraceae bacterium]|nr:hypothetical protein [Candidatus Vicinibacter affinis]
MRKNDRFIVYPKDLISLTGKSLRYCQNLLAKIRLTLGKDRSLPVTKNELGKYLKLSKEDLEEWKLE